MCTLEIVLEITTALPDKACRPIQPSISKSPNIFASGGTATFRTARAFDWPSLLRYASLYLLNDLARTAHAAERYEFCGCQKRRGQLWGQLSNTPQAAPLHYGPHIELFHSGPGTSRHRSIAVTPPMLTATPATGPAPLCRPAAIEPRLTLQRGAFSYAPAATRRTFPSPRGKTHIERRSRLQPFPSNETVCPAAQGFRNRQTFETDASS